ncbi:hypothetical protein KP509_07G044300 [Ceratopteris richardii]|uniref:Uncharacterized protein n=1 Tax=Ceratopteris richardii TaxID=49495 RepID=A0A8T2UAH0_CERRI|nr:hypothetical protein KP509_07G044300 [Ceratopteris richardii]
MVSDGACEKLCDVVCRAMVSDGACEKLCDVVCRGGRTLEHGRQLSSCIYICSSCQVWVCVGPGGWSPRADVLVGCTSENVPSARRRGASGFGNRALENVTLRRYR